MPILHRLFLLLSCFAFTMCGTIRQNFDTLSFKATYGGAGVRTSLHLREPEGYVK